MLETAIHWFTVGISFAMGLGAGISAICFFVLLMLIVTMLVIDCIDNLIDK